MYPKLSFYGKSWLRGNSIKGNQAAPPSKQTPHMKLSSLVKTVRERISAIFQINHESKDGKSNEYRGMFYLSQFNVIKLESILEQPLTDLSVPIISWPLRDLPSENLESNISFCFVLYLIYLIIYLY